MLSDLFFDNSFDVINNDTFQILILAQMAHGKYQTFAKFNINVCVFMRVMQAFFRKNFGYFNTLWRVA